MQRFFIAGGSSAALLAPLIAIALFLTGCTPKEKLLAGERFEVRADLAHLLQSPQPNTKNSPKPTPLNFGEREEISGSAPIKMAAPHRNKTWHQHGNNSALHSQNLALGDIIAPLWQISIGQGNRLRTRINASPIIDKNRIFTIDSALVIKAHTISGEHLWSRSILPENETRADVSTGALSYEGGKIFATTGFGDIVALSAENGAILWRQKLGSIALGAATPSSEGIIYVSSANGFGWAIDAQRGRVIWSQQGNVAKLTAIAASSPTLIDRFVIFPYGSGQITASVKNTGIVVWQAAVVGTRRGRAYSGTALIASNPIFDGQNLYVGSNMGELVALKPFNGKLIWSIKEGVSDNIWHEGDSLFAISDISQLMRINAKTGGIIWKKSLSLFNGPNIANRNKITGHYGPIIAGGKIWIGSEDSGLNAYSPENGNLLQSYEIPGGAASAPIVVNNRLYIISTKGILHVFQ